MTAFAKSWRDDKQKLESTIQGQPLTSSMAGSGRRRTAATVSHHIRPRPQHRGTNMMNAVETIFVDFAIVAGLRPTPDR